MPAPKMLIDCDPGHDDALAILYAAQHVDLVGLTTVHGNNTLENTTRNALAVLELGGLDVPVAVGCAEPLAQPRAASAAVHGDSGLDGADLPQPTRSPTNMHGVDFLIEMARQYRGELVVAVIGPQTNIALALRREPRLKEWIRELTIMGGSTGRGNITPAAEFNIHCDPEAAWTVFNSGLPIKMVGLNVTRQTGFNDADIARLRASGPRAASVMADLMSFYLARQRERRDTKVAPVHDVCAIVPYVDASLLEYADGRVNVELAGTHTRGMTVCHLEADLKNTDPASVAQINASIAIAARERDLVEHLITTVLRYP
ncbi:MAG: nucleoside hydrolase [Hyphomicrobiaceae bacterium]